MMLAVRKSGTLVSIYQTTRNDTEEDAQVYNNIVCYFVYVGITVPDTERRMQTHVVRREGVNNI